MRPRSASPRLAAEAEAFSVWLDPAAGSCGCCVCSGLPWLPLCLPAGSVSACVCRGKVHSGHRNWDDFFGTGMGCQDAAQCCFLAQCTKGMMVCFGHNEVLLLISKAVENQIALN